MFYNTLLLSVIAEKRQMKKFNKKVYCPLTNLTDLADLTGLTDWTDLTDHTGPTNLTDLTWRVIKLQNLS